MLVKKEDTNRVGNNKRRYYGNLGGSQSSRKRKTTEKVNGVVGPTPTPQRQYTGNKPKCNK